jgi:membrane protease YdiL (CAAX protease family)
MTNLQDKKRTMRNLIIFGIVIIVAGWLAPGLDALIGATSPEESLGMLIWIVVPVGTSLLLRAFAGDGWKDLGIKPRDGWKDLGIKPNIKGNGLWYAISILIYPISVAIIIAVGLVFGATSWRNTASEPSDAIIQALIALFIKEIVINILEEFAFRGYLAPKMYSLDLNTWIAHVLVGLIWGIWHLPVLRSITPYTSESLVTLAPRFVIAAIAASLVYGEIRLLTRSVWPAVLMQIAGGVAISAAMSFDLLSIKPAAGFLFNPVFESLSMIIILALVGFGLHNWRERNARLTRA